MSDRNIYEDLPVSSFNEVKKLIIDKKAVIGIRRDLALECAQKGIFLSQKHIKRVKLFVLTPFFTISLYTICTLLMGYWKLLFGFPVLMVGYFILHPNSLSGTVQSVTLFVLVSTIILGVYYDHLWLSFLSSILFVNYVALNKAYSSSLSGIRERALESEENFKNLWKNKIISLHMLDGSRYFRDFALNPNGEVMQHAEAASEKDKLYDTDIEQFLNNHSEFFNTVIQSSSEYWLEVIKVSNDFKDDPGEELNHEWNLNDYITESVCYAYVVTFIGLLRKESVVRHSNLGILLELGLQGAAVDLIIKHEKESLATQGLLSERDEEVIKENTVNKLASATNILSDYFRAHDDGEDSLEYILADYFIKQVNSRSTEPVIQGDLRDKIPELTRIIIDKISGS